MKIKSLKKTVLTGLTASSLLLSINSYAQTNDSINKLQQPLPTIKSQSQGREGFKFALNEDGSNYVQLRFSAQLWVSDNQNNPGSTVNGVGGVAGDNSYQVALRRLRFQVLSQLTDHVFIYGQFASDGISSLAGGRNVPLQYLDATVEYKFGRYLSLGGGLNGWDGSSRFSNAATNSILGLDAPLYQQATSNVTDNATRQPGIFAKGKLGKLDYRVAADIPYLSTTTTAFTNSVTVIAAENNPQFNAPQFALNRALPQFQGYFMYQFLDEESNLIPNTIGTYLGQKTVFNIGAGFRYQQNALWQGGYITSPKNAKVLNLQDTTRTNMLLWSVDLFYDAPINKEKGTAVSVYAAYSYYNFGTDYIRTSSALNPTTTSVNASFNGAGNLYPLVGTGSVGYVQAGYLLPKFKNGTQLQPYGQLQYSHLDALTQDVALWDLGLNYLIKGHNSKVSLDYQSRPIYYVNATTNSINESASARRGLIVLQYQVSF